MIQRVFKWLRMRLGARRIADEDPGSRSGATWRPRRRQDDLDPISELVRVIGERDVDDRRAPRADAAARRKQPRRR
jgi:hypothetical protein